MADTNTTTPKEEKAKTVANDMTSRRIFDTAAEAGQYLRAAVETFDDFGGDGENDIPLVAPGIDDEGNFDPEIYNDSMNVMVAVLKKQGEGAKAVIVTPVPKVSALLESEAGKAWVEKILHKEMNHVAVRHLRDAADVTAYVDQMPTTVEGYITSERGTGGIIETYNELYKGIDAALSEKLPVWQKARLTKGEFKKALESKGYALEFYSALEDYKGSSLFDFALDMGVAAAKRKGLDPTIFERWKATRNTKTYTAGEDEDEELDLESLTDALLGDTETEATTDEATDETAAETEEATA